MYHELLYKNHTVDVSNNKTFFFYIVSTVSFKSILTLKTTYAHRHVHVTNR